MDEQIANALRTDKTKEIAISGRVSGHLALVVFVYAECVASGAGNWNCQYWDALDAGQRLIIDVPEKGETVFE